MYCIVAQAFKNRLWRLLHILRTWFGSIIYLIKVIKFQKWGLPHAHIIIKVHTISYYTSYHGSFTFLLQVKSYIPHNRIDLLITAELPKNNPVLRAKIQKFMTHQQDHLTQENSHCRKGNTCIYGFPHPITPTTWIDEEGRVHYKWTNEDDQWITSHISQLINELDCHIHVDIVFTIQIFMYLYKYLFKGPDHTQFHLLQNQETGDMPRMQQRSMKPEI